MFSNRQFHRSFGVLPKLAKPLAAAVALGFCSVAEAQTTTLQDKIGFLIQPITKSSGQSDTVTGFKAATDADRFRFPISNIATLSGAMATRNRAAIRNAQLALGVQAFGDTQGVFAAMGDLAENAFLASNGSYFGDTETIQRLIEAEHKGTLEKLMVQHVLPAVSDQAWNDTIKQQISNANGPLKNDLDQTILLEVTAYNAPEAVWFGNFGDGLWQGEYVTLSNPGTGNPNGGGELDAIALGDGENGYFLAPAHLMGDWRAADAMQVVLRLKSGNGSYYGPYVDGGRGDIYLESEEMSASIEFDHKVGTEWTTQTVRFDDPQWQLSGAPSVRSILANVTRFDLRAEYLNGDTRSALASIDWISDAVAPRASKLGKTGKSADVAQTWHTYANARFGTRITYPTDLFTPMAAPDNNDGRSFAGIGGAQAFYVFGQSNFDALGVSALMERDISLGGYSKVTYKTRGEDWYVLSGYLGKHIFYRKVLVDRANDILHVFEITYPADQKMAYNAIVTKMAASLAGP